MGSRDFDTKGGIFRIERKMGLPSFFLAFIAAVFVFSTIPVGLHGASAPALQDKPADLADILKRCSAYCDRLSGSILDFVCLEQIEEMVAELAIRTKDIDVAGFENTQDPMKIAKSSNPGQVISALRIRKKVKSSFTYDYQLIQDNLSQIKETRTLIKKNGRSVLEKNAPLELQVFNYNYIVMGPSTLLAWDRQSLFDFKIIKETTVGKDQAIIIEATPKPGTPGEILHGKIWVRKSDAGVLKIEWVPESIGHYEGILALAKQIQAKPRLTMTTEFAFERNGIRFPSFHTIEEAYIFESGPPLIRSMTKVTQADYKFFKVETRTTLREKKES